MRGPFQNRITNRANGNWKLGPEIPDFEHHRYSEALRSIHTGDGNRKRRARSEDNVATDFTCLRAGCECEVTERTNTLRIAHRVRIWYRQPVHSNASLLRLKPRLMRRGLAVRSDHVHLMPTGLLGCISFEVCHTERPWSHETHLAPEYVYECRQFVQAR